MDVLVLTGEPLPLPGQVTTGAGLRAWGLMRGLRCAGLDAKVATRRLAMPGVEEEPARAHHTLLWEPATIAEQVERWRPGCIVAQHWGLLRDVPPLAQPLAIDLAGPHLLERRLWGAENWAEHLEEKLAALRRADFVVCSGERQRLYFLNHVALAGFPVTSELLPVIPFSVSPALPEQSHAADQFVYGGMFLPWQDPRLAIDTLLDVMECGQRGHLHFWGGPHPRLDVSRGRFDALLARLAGSPRVSVHGLTACDAYVDAIGRCGVALDVMARNPERELAFATRTVLYLWAGLPVIHGDGDELAPLIAEWGAGWVVDASDRNAIERAIREALDQPEEVARRGIQAQALVRARLTWDKTIEPLAVWCRSPRRRDGKLEISLAFESKDREITRLTHELREVRSELDTLRGKLSWQIADRLLSLRWLWAGVVWLALLPACLLLGLLIAIAEWLPGDRDAREFPSPPRRSPER